MLLSASYSSAETPGDSLAPDPNLPHDPPATVEPAPADPISQGDLAVTNEVTITESQDTLGKDLNYPHTYDSDHFSVTATPNSIRGEGWDEKSVLNAAEEMLNFATTKAGFDNLDLPASGFRLLLHSFDYYPELKAQGILGFASDGTVSLDSDLDFDKEVATHEAFHLIQQLLGAGTGLGFPDEGIANTISLLLDDANSTHEQGPYFAANPAISLDCMGDFDHPDACGGDALGHARWPYYYYLAQTYGPAIIGQFYKQEQAFRQQDGPYPDEHTIAIDALNSVLRNYDSNLGQSFIDFANFNLTNNYAGNAHDVYAQPNRAVKLLTNGAKSQYVELAINHLAAKYLSIGSESTQCPCESGDLKISVRFLDDIVARPAIQVGDTTIELELKHGLFGNRATATITDWSPDQLIYLALANGSLVYDNALFGVSVHFKPTHGKLTKEN